MFNQVECFDYGDDGGVQLKEANLDGMRVVEWQGFHNRNLISPDQGQRYLTEWFAAAKEGNLESFGVKLANPPWATYRDHEADIYIETGKGGLKPSRFDRRIAFRAIPPFYVGRLNHISISIGHCANESQALHGEIQITAFSRDQLEKPLAKKLIELLKLKPKLEPTKMSFKEEITTFSHDALAVGVMTSSLFSRITSVLGLRENSIYYFDPQLQHAVWEVLDFMIKNNLCGEVPTPRGPNFLIDERSPDGKPVSKSSKFYRESINEHELRLTTAYGVKLNEAGIPLYYSYYTSVGLEHEIVRHLGLRPKMLGKHRELIRQFFTSSNNSEQLMARYPKAKTRLSLVSNAFVSYDTGEITTWHEFSQRLNALLPDFANIIPESYTSLQPKDVHDSDFDFDIRNPKDGQGINVYFSTSSGICNNH